MTAMRKAMKVEDKILTLVTLTIMGMVVVLSLWIIAEQLPVNQQRYNMTVNYEDLR